MADQKHAESSGPKELQYGQKDEELNMPNYLSVIFAGGGAKRFGDVKALGFLGGMPLLERLINALPGGLKIVGIGPFSGAEEDLNSFSRDTLLFKDDVSENQKNRVKRYLYADEVSQFIHILRDKIFSGQIGYAADTSKASYIVDLADCINLRYRLNDIQTSDVGVNYCNIITKTRGFSLNLLFDKTYGKILNKCNDKLRKEIVDKIFANRYIVAVNGDSIIESEACYRSEKPDELNLESIIHEGTKKLQNSGGSAYLGLFSNITPSQGRVYVLNKEGGLESISAKDRIVNEEAGVFIFNPKDLCNISIPKLENNIENGTKKEEFRYGLNWLCQQLLSQNKKVYAKKYDVALFNLNQPEDYFVLRKQVRKYEVDKDLQYLKLFREGA